MNSNYCWPSVTLQSRQTVPESPGDLAGDSRAEAWGRLAVTAEVTERVRVSAGRWCWPNASTEGDSDTEEDFRNHLG